MNPSYFDVNYRGTIGFDTLPYDRRLYICHVQQFNKRIGRFKTMIIYDSEKQVFNMALHQNNYSKLCPSQLPSFSPVPPSTLSDSQLKPNKEKKRKSNRPQQSTKNQVSTTSSSSLSLITWRFPEIGLPINHPFIDGIFHEITIQRFLGVP